VNFDEKTLKQLLASEHGTACGQAVLEAMEHGEATFITMIDGSVLRLHDVADARNLLRVFFGWVPKI
jgi:hypothetical protein